jgi:pilus assembly protein CpaD
LAASLLLAGCGINPELAAPAPLAPYPPPKQIEVRLASFNHDIHFAPGAKRLTSAQASGLASFLTHNGIGQGDTVTVASAGSTTKVATARRAAVLNVLKAYQIPARSGIDTSLAPDTIRVHAAHAVAIAPACPDWSKPEANEPENRPSSNYACATEANLAAMIANPVDLVKPRDSNIADADALARGAALYRSGNLAKSLASSSGYSTSGLSGSGSSPSPSSGSSQ